MIRMGPSDIHGQGAFAARRILKGERIDTKCLYEEPLDLVSLFGDDKLDWFVVFSGYNHSHDPNVDNDPTNDFCVVAVRDIEEGEELTKDYAAFGGTLLPNGQRCNCPKCR